MAKLKSLLGMRGIKLIINVREPEWLKDKNLAEWLGLMLVQIM